MKRTTKLKVARRPNPEEGQVEVTSEIITPERAAEILGARGPNRSIKMAKVKTFARDMRSGNWLENGQTISLSMEGKLLDGQHRLMAVIESETAVRFLIARHVSALTFHTIDSGSARSFADVLHIGGEGDAKSLAAACRFLHGYRMSGGKSLEPNNYGGPPSTKELQELLAREEGIKGSLWARKVGKALGNGSLWVFLHYTLARIDKMLADLFFDSLATGANMKESDPVYLLREQVIRSKSNGRMMGVTELTARVFKAWNATRTARPLRKIQVGHPNEKDALPKPE